MSYEDEKFDDLEISSSEVRKLILDYYDNGRHEAETLADYNLALSDLDNLLDSDFIDKTTIFLNSLGSCDSVILKQYLVYFRQKHTVIKNAISNIFLQEIALSLPKHDSDITTRNNYKNEIIGRLLKRANAN